MNMIDVFSGFGGRSEAFLSNGWEVLRIDNNPLLSAVPNIRIQDVKDFLQDCKLLVETHGLPTLDYLHMSPPCLEFSNAYSAPKSKAIRANIPYEPSMELFEICLELIDVLKPRYWSIENVVGSIKYIEPYIGKHRLKIGPYVYWGNFPHPSVNGYIPPKKSARDKGPSNPLRSNYKAIIPYPISDMFRKAMEAQKSLTYWF